MDKYENIIDDIFEKYGVKKQHLFSRRRNAELVKVKKLTYWTLRQAGLSLPKIGKLMNKDHSTVLYGIRTFKDN
jgi:chromosomal replication initiation ATPase DnaA